MPTVNKVSKRDAVTPVSEQQGSPMQEGSPVVTQQSANVQVGNLNLPAFLAQDDNLPTIGAGEFTGYVGFADPRAKAWEQQQSAGLIMGDPFIMNDGQYIKLLPMEYVMLCGWSGRTERENNSEAKFVWASDDVDDDSNQNSQAHYLALMLVRNGHKLIPVRGDFMGPKEGAVKNAFNTVKDAGKETWGSLSDAHKVSCAFPKPWGRVWNTITVGAKRQSKSNGNFYVPAYCKSTPINPQQLQMLYDHFADVSFMNAVNRAKASFDERVTFLLSLKQG